MKGSELGEAGEKAEAKMDGRTDGQTDVRKEREEEGWRQSGMMGRGAFSQKTALAVGANPVSHLPMEACPSITNAVQHSLHPFIPELFPACRRVTANFAITTEGVTARRENSNSHDPSWSALFDEAFTGVVEVGGW